MLPKCKNTSSAVFLNLFLIVIYVEMIFSVAPTRCSTLRSRETFIASQHKISARAARSGVRLPEIVFPDQLDCNITRKSSEDRRSDNSPATPRRNYDVPSKKITEDNLLYELEKLNSQPAPQPNLTRVTLEMRREFSRFFGADETGPTEITNKAGSPDDADNVMVTHLCIGKSEERRYNLTFTREGKAVQLVQMPNLSQNFKIEYCGNSADSHSQPHCLTKVSLPGHNSMCKQRFVYRQAVVWTESQEWDTEYISLPAYCECVLVPS